MTSVRRPLSLAAVDATAGELRAGGTDLHARERLGVQATDTIVDLRDVGELRGINATHDGGWWIGAMERITSVATHGAVAAAYPALVATAGSLANPHIRQVATIGGNLLQRTRCPYFRHADIDCFKSGGTGCPARHGDHYHGVIFDTGPCVAPHPSSIAMALLAYDARVTVHGADDRSLSDLYGDGSDPTRDHLLEPEAVLTGVRLGPGMAGERAAYWRANGRIFAEWPLVEAVCRLTLDRDTIATARVAVGGVAPVPIRLFGVESALAGGPTTPEAVRRAAADAPQNARPLPQTTYKLDLLTGIVEHVVTAAIEGSVHTEVAVHETGLGWV